MNPNPIEPDEDEVNSQLEPLDYNGLFQKARRFQEVMEEINPQGPFVPMAQLLDRELCVISIRFATTKKGPAAFPAFVSEDGEIAHTFTASKVVVPKLQGVAKNLPVIVRFVQKEGGAFGKFYDIE